MPPSTDIFLVITTVPNIDTARSLAEKLVNERAAACVNIIAPCISTYLWQGKLETAEEHTLLIKTSRSRYQRLEQLIQEVHPYELPEIIGIPVEQGLPAYLAWVAAETKS